MSIKQTQQNEKFAKTFTELLLKQGGPMYALGYLESMIGTEMDRNPKFRVRVLERIATNKQRAA
jgi:hypothetical protein